MSRLAAYRSEGGPSGGDEAAAVPSLATADMHWDTALSHLLMPALEAYEQVCSGAAAWHAFIRPLPVPAFYLVTTHLQSRYMVTPWLVLASP